MTWPSPQRLAVGWAKANTAITAVAGDAIATTLPTMPPFVSPFLTVGLVAGAPVGGEAPLNRPMLQWDCWATSIERPGPDWPGADALAQVLLQELFHAGPRAVSDLGWVYGFEVVGERRVFEADRPYARFSFDAFMTCREVVEA